jgi:hypothetical protein
MAWNRSPMTTSLAMALALILSACTPSAPPATKAPEIHTEKNWQVGATSFETATDLNGTKTAQQYDGTTTTTDLAKRPEAGYTYLLVELVVEKMIPGSPAFRWSDVRVMDAEGNAYGRLANDTFLESFGFHRIKSTDLTLGRNEGYACFEIPESSADGPLVLVHVGDDGETRIVLK